MQVMMQHAILGFARFLLLQIGFEFVAAGWLDMLPTSLLGRCRDWLTCGLMPTEPQLARALGHYGSMVD